MAASFITLTVVFGFYALFYCLDILEAAAKTTTTTTQSGLGRLAHAALVPAVLTTLALTPLLLYAHVRALRRADAAGVVARLANATLLVAVVALVSGAGVRLGLGGADDVGWLNDKYELIKNRSPRPLQSTYRKWYSVARCVVGLLGVSDWA